MGLNLRNILKSFLLAAVLLPAIAFANTEFKGTETVNINRADAATLAAYLKGVGVNKAKDIVAYRNNNGKFKSIEDIKNVPGVGDETFKDNKRKMSISRGKTAAPEGYKLGKASGKSKSKKSTTKKSSTKKSTASSKDDTSSSNAKKTKTTAKKKASSSKSKSDTKSSSRKSSSKSTTVKKKTTKTKAKKPKKTIKKKTTSKKKKGKKKTK